MRHPARKHVGNVRLSYSLDLIALYRKANEEFRIGCGMLASLYR